MEFVEALAQAPIDVPLLVLLILRPRQASPRITAALAYGRDLGTIERLEVEPLTLDESAGLLGKPPTRRRSWTCMSEPVATPVPAGTGRTRR